MYNHDVPEKKHFPWRCQITGRKLNYPSLDELMSEDVFDLGEIVHAR